VEGKSQTTRQQVIQGETRICINADDCSGLTVGKRYTVIGPSSAHVLPTLIVVCDDGSTAAYAAERFSRD